MTHLGHSIKKSCGWGTRIRTWECTDQNRVPYHLAIPHRPNFAHLLASDPRYARSACSLVHKISPLKLSLNLRVRDGLRRDTP